MIANIPSTLLAAEGEMLATNHRRKSSDESLDPVLTDSLPPAKKAKLAPTVYKWTKDCDNLMKCKWKEYSKYNSEDLGLSLRYNQDLIDMNKAYSPHEIAELLFSSDEVLTMIKGFTEKYAAEKNNQHFSISINELKVFFSIILLSGYVKCRNRRMYWESSPDTHNIAVSSAMSRNRFDEIMKFIYFYKNDSSYAHHVWTSALKYAP